MSHTIARRMVTAAALVVWSVAPALAGAIDTNTGTPVVGDASLRLWLDASDAGTLFQDTAGTTAAVDGLDVALWKDKSGNAKDVSNTNAAALPTYAASVANLGGSGALQFVGGSGGDMLFRVNDLGISGNDDRTVVTVWQNTAFTGQNYQHTFHMGDQSTNEAYGQSTSRAGGAGSPIGNHYYGAGFDTSATAALNTATVAVSSWDGDGGTGTNGLDSWWVDGAYVGASDRAALATGTDQLKIGSRLNGGTTGNEGFTGDLAEVLVFNRVLTAAERNALGHYIQTKYGIAVQDAATYANVVFDDNFTAPNGTLLDGKEPVVGGAVWDQTSGINVIVQNNAIDTTGGARVLLGTFTDALDPGESLIMEFDATKLSTGGFAGLSLLAGGSEQLFVGDTNDGTDWAMAVSHLGGTNGTDKFSTGIGSGAGTALFTYVYDTGLARLSIDGSSPIVGYLPAAAAIDQLQIWNNNGGDIGLDAITVKIVPEPSTFVLALGVLFGLGLLGWRRRRR